MLVLKDLVFVKIFSFLGIWRIGWEYDILIYFDSNVIIIFIINVVFIWIVIRLFILLY